MKLLKYILSVSILFILTSCRSEKDCIKSAGTIRSEIRNVGVFRYISLYDNIELILRNDTGQVIEVKTGDHLISSIVTELNGFELIIKNVNSCNWVRSYKDSIKVYVSQPLLESIHQYGSGEITSEDKIVLSDLEIYQYGSGDISLNVSLNTASVDMNGIGNVSLQGTSDSLHAHVYNLGGYRFGMLNSLQLRTKIADINSETQADAYVYSDSLLLATVANTGNIYYEGNPMVISTKIGKGNIIKK